MRKTLFTLGIAIILGILYSCEDTRNIRYYNLNIELNEPITNLKESDPMPDYLKVFINYTDTSSSSDLLVPEVTFIRTDIKSANSFKLEPLLTWINTFRKGRGMLPAEYLKEDYNSLVNKLTTPKILTEAKGKAGEPSSETADYGDNSFFLNIYKVKPDSVIALKEKVTRKLLSSKGNISIKLVIINKPFDQAQIQIIPEQKDTIIETMEQKPQTVVIKPEVNNKQQGVNKPKPNPVSDTKIITANSFEDYLQKIGDPSIPYESKVNLKTRIVEKYFTGDDALVVFIGQNENEVSHQNIKVFIEDLSQRNFKFTILNKKNSNNKINTLNIREQ